MHRTETLCHSDTALIRALLLACLIFCLPDSGRTQDKTPASRPFILGRTDTIRSSILQETRELNIYLPEGYDPDSASTYPVIYLLDGSASEDFLHVAGIVQFLNFPWVNQLPKSILVGIANIDRKRDFTFPTRNRKDSLLVPQSGHSAAFIRFIREELQPYIQSHYMTGKSKTLVGESLGGLLASEILLKEPELFTDYILISPSLWWDDESLLKAAPAWLKKHAYRNTKVYISVGSEGKQMENDAAALVSLLRSLPGGGIHVYTQNFPAETHATIFHLSLYRAFVLMNRNH